MKTVVDRVATLFGVAEPDVYATQFPAVGEIVGMAGYDRETIEIRERCTQLNARTCVDKCY